MSHDFVYTYWLLPEGMSTENVRTLVERVFDIGWEADSGGDDRDQYRYSTDRNTPMEYGEFDALLASVDTSYWTTSIRYEALETRLTVNRFPEVFGDIDHLVASIDQIQLAGNEVNPAETLVDWFFDVFDLITEHLEVDIGYTLNGHTEKYLPTADDVESERLEQLYCKYCWINLLPERVLDTIPAGYTDVPVWDVREYDHGSVAFVSQDHPCRPSENWKESGDDAASYFGTE